MAEPYRTLELFNAFVGAGFKYEELFPQPLPKPDAQKPAERPAVEVQRPEERGLRREVVEKPAAKPEAAGPEVVRSLRRGEKPRAPVADVIPEGVLETVDYLLERFGLALDRGGV